MLLKVTTFTFSKNKSSCEGETDLRVRFSTPWTLVNCFVSTIIVAIVSALVTNFIVENGSGVGSSAFYSWLLFFTPSVVLHILGVICTVSFIWFDHISCCCCDCWRGQQEVVVYDPDHPEASLVWRDGEVVDLEKTSNDVVEINPRQDNDGEVMDKQEETENAETEM